MKTKIDDIEILRFRDGDKLATVVTDGQHIRTYEPDRCEQHDSLYKAIGFLESRNYNIIMD